MATITLEKYILQFCCGKYAIWLKQRAKMKHVFKWEVYSDVDEWYDADNNLLIVDRTPIGD